MHYIRVVVSLLLVIISAIVLVAWWIEGLAMYGPAPVTAAVAALVFAIGMFLCPAREGLVRIRRGAAAIGPTVFIVGAIIGLQTGANVSANTGIPGGVCYSVMSRSDGRAQDIDDQLNQDLRAGSQTWVAFAYRDKSSEDRAYLVGLTAAPDGAPANLFFEKEKGICAVARGELVYANAELEPELGQDFGSLRREPLGRGETCSDLPSSIGDRKRRECMPLKTYVEDGVSFQLTPETESVLEDDARELVEEIEGLVDQAKESKVVAQFRSGEELYSFFSINTAGIPMEWAVTRTLADGSTFRVFPDAPHDGPVEGSYGHLDAPMDDGE